MVRIRQDERLGSRKRRSGIVITLILLLTALAYWLAEPGVWHSLTTSPPEEPAIAATDLKRIVDVLPLPANALMTAPYGLTRDAGGQIFITESGKNSQILKLAADGTMTVLAGAEPGYRDGPLLTARFDTPSAIAADAAGNLYVADTGNHAIRKIDPDGQVTTIAGNGQPGDKDGRGKEAQFNGPVGLAVAADGGIYVADTYNDKIRHIAADGTVTTVAGSGQHGYSEGEARRAMLDTPCAVALTPSGVLIIADTRNHAIRMLNQDGQLRTIYRSLPDQEDSLLHKPVALAVTHDNVIIVAGQGEARLLQLTLQGELHGLSGIDANFESGDQKKIRLNEPSAISLDRQGHLLVADSGTHRLYRTVAHTENDDMAAYPPLPVTVSAPAQPTPWPLLPQHAAHEVVGTVGEVRGNYDGEARDHFHGGLDIQGNMGSIVYAIADETVRSPLATWAYEGLGEGLNIDQFSYIHMRTGRRADQQIIDPQRFQLLSNPQGQPDAVRVRRGTHFRAGDALGSINRMYHVHLNYQQYGQTMNPLLLGFPGFRDDSAPLIRQIRMLDSARQPFAAGKDHILNIPAGSKEVHVVAEAYDQSSQNLARRKLGLYQLGYQLLDQQENPLPGYTTPVMNLVFNQLPPDQDAVRIAYAEGSGITVYGSAETRFIYELTNRVRDGRAQQGSLSLAELKPGTYILRVHAVDFAGNQAKKNRDLTFRIAAPAP